jgi:hypothetical protein
MVIPFPAPVYRRKDNSTVQAMKASHWKWPYKAHVKPEMQYLEHKFYTTTPQILNYVVIAVKGCAPDTPDWYAKELIPHFAKCGISEKQAQRISTEKINPFLQSTTETDLRSKLNEASKHSAKLVILVLPEHELNTYRDFKNLAD